MAKLPWPKSMRWKPGLSVRWVRPLHSILCTFDGELVPFSFAGVSSGLHTQGHRFLSQGKIEAKRFDDYAQKLKAAHVVLEADERAAIIFDGVKQAAFVHGLEMIPDEGLLAEVAGLAEWPVVYIGTIQNEFMDVPAEILQTSMRTHQKYFSLRDPKTGKMANRFAMVANMIASDGGKEIVAGNERVLRARLSDAKFFWDEDRKKSLESRVKQLDGITFHARAGTQHDRAMRIDLLAAFIAQSTGGDIGVARKAGRLAKADLTTGVVSEFPELQGLMGQYYALNDKLAPEVAVAIRDQYKPLGPGDSLPQTAEGLAVALADKLDMLATLWRAGERATGSRDPFGLRRAALGVIRIILERNIRFKYLDPIVFSLLMVRFARDEALDERARAILSDENLFGTEVEQLIEIARKSRVTGTPLPDARGLIDQEDFDTVNELAVFIVDRLKVVMRERGVSHDVIDAIVRYAEEDDILLSVARATALQSFLKSDDGANLLAGYKRAANILKVEEKKDGKTFISEVSEKLLSEPAEKALFAALASARATITPALEKEDFAAAMQQMAALRVPVDAFFDAVKVNADDKQVRENRLNLLASLRATLHQVADFSRIEG